VDFSKHPDKRKPRIDLSPSSADRWATCTASPGYIFDNWHRIPPEDGNQFSQEGTAAHEVAAANLQNRKPDPLACEGHPIDADMHWHGWNYAEYVTDLREPGSKLLVEQKLPLWYAPTRNCIIDAAVINPNSIHIVDYKYGAGIIVSTERNKQAVIYAKTVGNPLNLPDDFPVSIHIYQPRGRAAEDMPFHVWETTWAEIQEIARGISDTAKDILDATDPKNPKPQRLEFKASEKACQWCPAKAFCPERATLLLGGIESLGPMLPAAMNLPMSQVAAILRHGSQITKWVNEVQAYALNCMKAGGQIPGFKLVTSRGGNRYWTDDKKAAKLLLETTLLKREEVIEEKVISPAGIEKLIGKKKFDLKLLNLIGKPAGKPVIAPDDDARESCMIEGESEFEALDEPEEF